MKRNIWPYAIIAYFAVFITGIVFWVSFAMRHDDQLVRSDYYEHEIKFQDQIDRVARTVRAGATVRYDAAGQVLTVTLPKEMSLQVEGSVQFYRPSDARLDQKLDLGLDQDGSQRIDVSNLESGFWKVIVSWKSQGQEYYLEEPVVLFSRKP